MGCVLRLLSRHLQLPLNRMAPANIVLDGVRHHVHRSTQSAQLIESMQTANAGAVVPRRQLVRALAQPAQWNQHVPANAAQGQHPQNNRRCHADQRQQYPALQRRPRDAHFGASAPINHAEQRTDGSRQIGLQGVVPCAVYQLACVVQADHSIRNIFLCVRVVQALGRRESLLLDFVHRRRGIQHTPQCQQFRVDKPFRFHQVGQRALVAIGRGLVFDPPGDHVIPIRHRVGCIGSGLFAAAHSQDVVVIQQVTGLAGRRVGPDQALQLFCLAL